MILFKTNREQDQDDRDSTGLVFLLQPNTPIMAKNLTKFQVHTITISNFRDMESFNTSIIWYVSLSFKMRSLDEASILMS